ncbi:uncharacterized protein HD556DRAFT_1484503 [Suillus plorans]|uniref:Tyr recombinase domain-containing protein n=1 Tax=Suillus plorans TaxID=116603 RepID=A0A9P7DV48_9AGAM|nr:uncharacterized protein HD556DRAFT_1484503 [Suillus plorans]KAG1803881.1 hypothetical protein HD556DRAFT_1484503 [Suillus plorans]
MSETTMQPVPPLQNVNEQQVSDEMLNLELEEASEVEAKLDILLNECLDDFPDDDQSEIAQYASNIARNSITDQTRTKHVRIIKAYITFHMKRTPNWDPKVVTRNTPYDVRMFITQKCGPKADGYEGRKFSTAISTQAALTLWYRSVRPSESVVEWRVHETGQCSGLPTRSRAVSEFMIGLEKTKARQGEVSQSARALLLDDTVFLFAWLLVLRVEEALSLTFESIDALPDERAYFDVDLGTRKNAQTGVSQRMRLCANDQDPKICPKRALIRLAALYGENHDCTGPLFLVINKNGAVTTQPLSSTTISRALARDLQGLGYKSWALYGTHSFRRGGCQHRLRDQGWSPGMVAAWGGWSQVEAVTMFRYFYSPNDNHEHMIDFDRNDGKRVHQGSMGLLVG